VRRRELLAAGLVVPAVLLAGMDDALAMMPEPSASAGPAAVSSRLARLRGTYDAGNLARVIGALPDLLASADSLVRTSHGPARHALLAACYDLATEALNKTGYESASRITADRAVISAGLSGSAASAAYAARSLAIVLRHQGRQELAERVTLQAAGELDKTGLSTRMQAAVARIRDRRHAGPCHLVRDRRALVPGRRGRGPARCPQPSSRPASHRRAPRAPAHGPGPSLVAVGKTRADRPVADRRLPRIAFRGDQSSRHAPYRGRPRCPIPEAAGCR
jgi:hypothetical protein